MRWIGIFGLLVAGAWLANVAGESLTSDPFTTVALVLGVLALLFPFSRRAVAAALGTVRSAARWGVAATLFAGTFAVLLYSTLAQHPYLAPKSHDEHSYTLQAEMLASGRLWTSPPPHPESFDSFHITTSPHYASIYFPGTALLHVPAIWAHLPPWLFSLLLTAAAITVSFLFLSCLIDQDLALLAAILLLASPQLRAQSILTMSQVPALLLGMTTLYLATGPRTPVRTLLLGVTAGWLTITRPQDAACYLAAALLARSLPRGMGILPVRPDPAAADAPSRHHTGKMPVPREALLLAIGALPFLILQLTQNIGLTGSPFTTAFSQYIHAHHPGATFAFDTPPTSPTASPANVLPQQQIYAAYFAGQAAASQSQGLLHALLHSRIPPTLTSILPTPLIALVPLGLAALLARRKFLPLIPLALFLAIYTLYAFFLPHYPVAFAPLITLLPIAAALALPDRWANVTRPTLALLVTALTLAAIPGINPRAGDPEMTLGQLAAVDAACAKLQTPALLLIRFTPGDNVHQEPVYNLTPWTLTDNRILRAHDLSPAENQALLNALPASPNRHVYRYTRKTAELEDLGMLSDLKN